MKVKHLIKISSYFTIKSDAVSWAYKQKQLWQNGYKLYLFKTQAKNNEAYIVCRSCVEKDYTEPRLVQRDSNSDLLTAANHALRSGGLIAYPHKNVSEIKINVDSK